MTQEEQEKEELDEEKKPIIEDEVPVEEPEKEKEEDKVNPDELELVIRRTRSDYIGQLLEDENEDVSVKDLRNIITIYDKCSVTVKNAFDGDTTNDINSWNFSDWIKIILPIVKAIEKYNTTDKKGRYKKTVAIIITKCIIVNELTISEESRQLLLDAVEDYLKPSIDIIVYMINSNNGSGSSGSSGSLFKKCCPCFSK